MLEQGAALFAALVQNNPNPHGDLCSLVGVTLIVNFAGSLDKTKLSGEMLFERQPLRPRHKQSIPDRGLSQRLNYPYFKLRAILADPAS